jgi:hypothetical protein
MFRRLAGSYISLLSKHFSHGPESPGRGHVTEPTLANKTACWVGYMNRQSKRKVCLLEILLSSNTDRYLLAR